MVDASSTRDQLTTEHTKLLTDVSAVLEEHGHRLPIDPKARVDAYAQSMVALAYLVAAFEGHAVAGSIGRHAVGPGLSEQDAVTVKAILAKLDRHPTPGRSQGTLP